MLSISSQQRLELGIHKFFKIKASYSSFIEKNVIEEKQSNTSKIEPNGLMTIFHAERKIVS
ncbi:MAG: hypothetical protein ACTHJ2_02765 [Candidatus Nitrosocosmicus sp.]